MKSARIARERTLVSAVGKLGSSILDGLAVWTLIAAFVQFAIGTWSWPLPFVLHFFDASWCVWIVGFGCAARRRSKPRMILHASLMIVWLVLVGPRIMRGLRAEPPHVGGELRVLTLNAGNGCATPRQLCDALRACDADLVFLQELAGDNARAIENEIGLPLAYRALFPLGIPGKGVLARFPLRDVRLAQSEDGSNRVYAVLETPAGDVAIVDVHMDSHVPFLGPWIAVDEQIKFLAHELPQTLPTIIAGDFNLTTSSALLAPLRRTGFKEAFTVAGAGLGLSFPVFSRYRDLPLPPLVRIDQVWSRGFECLDARLGPDAGSDHLPLRARFLRGQ